MPLSIAVAEDNSFALEGLQRRLERYPELRLKFVARNGRELLQKLQKSPRVDLVLMDLRMPEMDGIEATAALKAKYPHIKVLILTTFDDEEHLFAAILAGASGYLLKDDQSTELLRAITDTMAGGAAMSPIIALKALQMIRQPLEPGQEKQDFGLTKRELELLSQLKNGLSYEEVAANLCISYHTVRKHIEHIYRKLQVNNKTAAVDKAAQHRLL